MLLDDRGGLTLSPGQDDVDKAVGVVDTVDLLEVVGRHQRRKALFEQHNRK